MASHLGVGVQGDFWLFKKDHRLVGDRFQRLDEADHLLLSRPHVRLGVGRPEPLDLRQRVAPLRLRTPDRMDLPGLVGVSQNAADALEDSRGDVGGLPHHELRPGGVDAPPAFDPWGEGGNAHELHSTERGVGGVLPAAAGRGVRNLIAWGVVPEVERDGRIGPDCGRLAGERRPDPIPDLVIPPAFRLRVGG